MPDSRHSFATSPSLLARVRDSGDASAWEQFTALYTPLVYRYCLRHRLQDADAADVAQEVMRAVARSVGRFTYDRRSGRFRGWLLTVTRNKLNDFFNRRNRQEQGSGRTSVHEMLAKQPDPQDADDWDGQCRQRVLEWAASLAKAEFADLTWRAFLLTAMEGRSAKEVSEVTGLSVGAVYIAKCRVIARLRALVASVDTDEPADAAPCNGIPNTNSGN